MKKNGFIYFLLGVYSAMTSWFYYHSVILLIINWVFWPISLLYFLLTGKYANRQWLTILNNFL